MGARRHARRTPRMQLALPLPAGRVPLRSSCARRTPARGRDDREYELADTGVLTRDRFFDVTVTYAKAAPDDICHRHRGDQPRPRRRRRCTCCRSCGSATPGPGAATSARPTLRRHRPAAAGRRRGCTRWSAEHDFLGRYYLGAEGATRRCAGLRQRDRTTVALFGAADQPGARTPRTASNRRVVHGDAVGGQPARHRHQGGVLVPLRRRRARRRPCALRLRLSTAVPDEHTFGPASTRCCADRRAEADEFYARVLPGRTWTTRIAHIARRAFAGLLWGKQLYRYSVEEWLDGDPGQPAPPPERAAAGARNVALAAPGARRRHLDARRVGVPVVRGLGPRVPLRRPGPRRPGVRQGAAAAAVPRVGDAPQRPAARPTSGPSATSTRRCTPGRPGRCT